MPGTFQTVVVCTGSEMVTLTIGPGGEPVPDDMTEDPHCVAAADVEPVASHLPEWQAFERRYDWKRVARLELPHEPRISDKPPGRAPPALIV